MLEALYIVSPFIWGIIQVILTSLLCSYLYVAGKNRGYAIGKRSLIEASPPPKLSLPHY